MPLLLCILKYLNALKSLNGGSIHDFGMVAERGLVIAIIAIKLVDLI